MAKKSKETLEVMQDRGVLTEIQISEISKTENYRKTTDPEELKALAESISKHGLLQPIGVSTEGKEYKLIYGSRRVAAITLLGKTSIRAYVYANLSDMEADVLAVVENLQRANPTPFDEAMAVIKLHDAGKDSSQIATLLGVSPLYVKRRMAIAKLPKKLKDAFVNGKMSIEHAAYVGSLDKKQQDAVVKEYKVDAQFDKWVIHRALSSCSLAKNRVNFDTKDPDLIPEMGPCTKCMYNTSVNELLRIEGEDDKMQCTNKSCYEKKTKLGRIKIIQNNPYQCTQVVTDLKCSSSAERKAFITELKTAGFTVIDDEKLGTPFDLVEEDRADNFKDYVAEWIEDRTPNMMNSDDFTSLQLEKIAKFEKELKVWISKNPDKVMYQLNHYNLNGNFIVDVDDYKSINDFIVDLGFKLLEQETETESDDQDDDNQDSGIVLNESEYTDISKVYKLQSKIERNRILVQGKIADHIKKTNVMEFTGPYMIVDTEGVSLTKQEQLAYFMCILGKLSGKVKARVYHLYAQMANKKDAFLENGDFGGGNFDHAEMAKFAMKEPKFIVQITRAFIWSIALTNVYRVNPFKEETNMDTSDYALQGILSHTETDGATLEKSINEIIAGYDKKSARLQERIDEFKVKEEA